MIMEWKKQPDNSFHANWRGVHYVLYEESTRFWHIDADGRQTLQSWRSARKAMDWVDNEQQKIIKAAAVQGLAKLVQKAGA